MVMNSERPPLGPHVSAYQLPPSRHRSSTLDENLVSSLTHPYVIATSIQMARTSGTLHVKQEAHVAAPGVACESSPKSGALVGPCADSPKLRPVVGLTSASIAFATCLATIGMLEKVVKISDPVA